MNLNTKKQILETSNALISDYREILNNDDINIINYVLNNLSYLTFEEIENKLLPIIKKIWDIELNTGEYIIISWNKYAEEKPKNIITFATLSKYNDIKTFNDSTTGTIYEINYESLLGAHWKDGATLIESKDKINEYTIGIIEDKAINSYNGATKLITPKQLIKPREIDYKSKHNELILDTRYIKEIGTFDLNNYHESEVLKNPGLK